MLKSNDIRTILSWWKLFKDGSSHQLRYKLLNEYKLNEHISHNHIFIFFLQFDSKQSFDDMRLHFCSLDIKHQPKTQSYLIKGHLIRNVACYCKDSFNSSFLYGQALQTKCCVNNLFDKNNSRINDLSALLIYSIIYRYNGGISCVVHKWSISSAKN